MLSIRWTLWNFFLAAFPVMLALSTAELGKRAMKKGGQTWWLLAVPMGAIWFAFLPNTCYLLTEWRHFLLDPQFAALRRSMAADRTQMLAVAQWGLFYVFYSGFGMVCFALSLRPIAHLLRHKRGLLVALTIPFFFLISAGVYMGLIVRLNSWDILRRPLYVGQVFMRIFETPLLLSTVVVFAVLLWLIYQAIEIWIDGAKSRIAKHRNLFASTF